MPRQVISTVIDDDGSTVWPTAENAPTGKRVISPGAAYIITDILAGNTDTKVNPFWGKWAIYDGNDAPAGRLQDGHDQRQPGRRRLRLRRPADGQEGAGARRRRLDGQQRQQPQRRQALARHLGAALVGDPDRGQPRARRSPSSSRRPGLETATVDAFTGLKPGPFTTKTVKEFFLPGHRPDPEGDVPDRGHDRRGDRPAVAGRLRRAEGHRGLLQPLRGRGQLPELAEGRTGTGARARPAAPASAAARRARGPRTSTTARSRRSGGPGARRSAPAKLARSTPPPASAIRSRSPTRSLPPPTCVPLPTVDPERRADGDAATERHAEAADCRPTRASKPGRLRTRRSSPRRRPRRAGRAASTSPAVAAGRRAGPHRAGRPSPSRG